MRRGPRDGPKPASPPRETPDVTVTPVSPEFPPDLDSRVSLGGGGEAYFGRDVLRGLVSGLRDVANRPRSERRWGPGVLACTMWMDDAELISVLGSMSNVCVIVTKQSARRYDDPKTKPLRDLAENNGLAQEAFPELSEYELVDETTGAPLVVGPYTPNWRENSVIHGVREVGFRKERDSEGRERYVPLAHAKIALVGQMLWSDEHPSGAVVDEMWFVPEKLWIGSANFTASSRRSIEIGMWTADHDLMGAARSFLLDLVKLSEPLGMGPNVLNPELRPIDYDAFQEYLEEHDSLDEA